MGLMPGFGGWNMGVSSITVNRGGVMSLIRCGGCNAVHESNLTACPVCGRCPHCGDRRVSASQRSALSTCCNCGTPFCDNCGRCHVCGVLRDFGVGPCECGHPNDPKCIEAVERHFALK